MEPAKQQIERLRAEIERHNHNYYVLNAPEISDYDFDQLLRQLERLEAEHPELDDPLSPTHRVGSDISKGFTQWTHRRPMLSLGNTYSIGEVGEWMARVADGIGGEPFQVVGEMKFDGTSIALTYEHGRLVRAVTRGDGARGDVVTDNVKTIRSIPLTLPGAGWPDEFEIRGEVLLPWKEFERLNAERAYNEEPLFANPRNAAAGTLKLLNSAEVARRGLDAVFYFLLGDNLPAPDHYSNLEAARAWGFRVSPMRLMTTVDEVDAFIAHWDSARKELPWATDGLVFKVNALAQQRSLGFTAKSPRWAVAYKFAPERALTPLRFVSFEVGRSGVVTPVANLAPVLLSGTVVKRASLHNADIIAKLDIHQGDSLYVEKGGEIIPKITGVDVASRAPGAPPVEFVSSCPVCGTPLVRVEGEAAHVCPNKLGCKPQICGRIEHFVGRRMMNIDGIGEEIAVMLYDNGLVRDPADLYALGRHRDAITRLPGMGQRSADRMLQAIEASKQAPFERVVFALSIPNVGETVAKRLARSLRNIDALMNADAATLTAIDDVGPRIAQSVVDFFAHPLNRDVVERLRAAGVTMAMPADAAAPAAAAPLAGKSIVISGTFTRHSRDEYKEIIERNGGKNAGSVSRKTDFILAGANMGPAKLEKARALGVALVGEDEFLAMLDS